jgi:carbon-monoxide dehydrogenase medium subunit
MLLTLPEFDALTARSVEEACALLDRYGAEAQVLAGGTDLLVQMKHRRVIPKRLINIKHIPGLDHIRYREGEGLRIGALATIQSIKDSPIVNKHCPLLAQAAGKVGTVHIRHLGTLGGNLANASPSAEFAPALLVSGASVICAGIAGERTIPIEKLFVSPGRTTMRSAELLTEIRVPETPRASASVYMKHSLRRMDVAVAAAAVFVRLEGDVCREAKIALGAVAPTPLRARKAEAALVGQSVGAGARQELFADVARIAADEALPIDDIRAFASFRREVVRNLVRQGLDRTIIRARA